MPSETPDDVIANVGRRLAELRAVRGWTQEQLAEAANVTVKYVQSVERGDENLTIKTMAKLASLVRSRVADLFVAPETRGPARLGRPRRSRSAK